MNSIIHLTRNCHRPGADPDAWFPPEPPAEEVEARAAYEATARELCAGCPFAARCLSDMAAIEARPGVSRHGIVAGLAPWERALAHRRAVRHRREALAVAS